MKTCPQGHPHTPENRYISYSRGVTRSSCRPCQRDRDNRRRAELAASRQPAAPRVLPPPAAQPEKSCALTRAELKAEREASRRRVATREAEYRRPRTPETYMEWSFVCGRASSRPSSWEDDE